VTFKPPELDDADAVRSSAFSCGTRENTASFVNLWLLREKYGTEIAFFEGRLVRHYARGSFAGAFSFFAREEDDVGALLRALEEEAARRGGALKLALLTASTRDAVARAAPGRFAFAERADYAEYLYARDELAALAGAKFAAKRNHSVRFRREHPDFAVRAMTADDLPAALAVADAWYAEHLSDDPEGLAREAANLRRAAANFARLKLRGVLLEAGGRAIGMSMTSEISRGVWDEHFEKVVPGFPDAWTVMAQETARALPSGALVNREEDLGLPGLRKSKLSYRPVAMVRKWEG